MTYESLPKRAGERPRTRKGMPHAQLGVQPVPKVDAELRRRAFSLPDVEERPTVVSVPGARGMWLRDDLPLARPEEIFAGREGVREFAHIHPDGSLHATLPPERAREAVELGWAEPHPLSEHIPNFPAVVMLYTPRTMEELDVIFGLVVDSYNYITGRTLDAAEVAAGTED